LLNATPKSAVPPWMAWITSIELGAGTDWTSTLRSVCRYSWVRGSVSGPKAVPTR